MVDEAHWPASAYVKDGRGCPLFLTLLPILLLGQGLSLKPEDVPFEQTIWPPNLYILLPVSATDRVTDKSPFNLHGCWGPRPRSTRLHSKHHHCAKSLIALDSFLVNLLE